MNIHRKLDSDSARGMALLMVLSAIALLSVLILGFLLGARTEFVTSKTYSAGGDVRLLADTAVNLVISQIQQATQDSSLAWNSQPGMARTFDANGQVAAYKLYSALTMVEKGAAYNPSDPNTWKLEVPQDWYARPEEFVDLNRPVKVGSRTYYPIADPAQAVDSSLSGNPSQHKIEGYTIDSAKNPQAPANSRAANPLPMPVRWIYLNADGKLIGSDDPKKAEAVARIAFWADDESSKVNVNTAAGGIFYDAPVASTKVDHDLARHQPVAQEYQRYPGHPATSDLSAVFKGLRDVASAPERSRLAAMLTPRVDWGGSSGGQYAAWWNVNNSLLGKVDEDRLYATIDEMVYTPAVDGSGNRVLQQFKDSSGTPASTASALIDNLNNIDQYRFFLTTQSKAPELNLFWRPRVTLWPFNKELLADSATNPLLTPEDRLIRKASEYGGKSFYFQRENAWVPGNDMTNIRDNKALYTFLQNMSSRSFPTANTVRSKSPATFESKYGTDNRNELLIQMIDYLRSFVNPVNDGYAPVASSLVYSFPQAHTTSMMGYDDVAPLEYNSSGTTYKGFGKYPVITDVIFQFYALGDEPEPGSSNPNRPDYMLRTVQMVVIPVFAEPMNVLSSAFGRFQLEISVPDFSLAPDITGTDNGLRIKNLSTGSWTSGAENLGFPGSADILVAGTQTAFSNWGGYLDLGMLFYVPDPGAKQFAQFSASARHISNNRYPRSLNHTGVDSNALGSPPLAINGGAYTNMQADFTYPFVSKVMTFRVPCSSTAVTTSTALLKPSELANQKAFTPYALFQPGGAMTITIYPGLQDKGAATLFGDKQAKTALNYIQKYTIPLNTSAVRIPLPQVVSGKNSAGADYILDCLTTQKKYYDLSTYAQRFRWSSTTGNEDLILQVPRASGSKGSPSTEPIDTILSYRLKGGSPLYGDLRLVALQRDVPSSWWEPHPLWGSGTSYAFSYIPSSMNTSPSILHVIGNNELTESDPNKAAAEFGTLLPRSEISNLYDSNSPARVIAAGANGALRNAGQFHGDYSDGYGYLASGATVIGPDYGAITQSYTEGATTISSPYYYPYCPRDGTLNTVGADANSTNLTGLLYSPYKQMPSAVMFGTLLPRALDPPASPSPWETLLFNPNPAGGAATHRGWTSLPRDHYWLDLFTMPVVEPYAISEGFATSGKINLNYPIVPFGYIERKTALYALMRTEQIVAMPPSFSKKYKGAIQTKYSNTDNSVTIRYGIDVAQTLKDFDTRLITNNDPFVSGSEICEMALYPKGVSGSVANFWNTNSMTGDDKREMPYNHLYPRVTTQSNTFKVHFCVQTLTPTTKENTIVTTGEFRGSMIVERYLDPNVTTYGTPIPSSGTGFSVDAVYPPLNDKYRFRKLDMQQFSL